MKTIRKMSVIIATLLIIECAIPTLIYRVNAGQYYPLDYPGSNCLSFKGVNDYVDCGGSQIFQQQNLTVEAWVKPMYTINIGSHPLNYNRTAGYVVSYLSGGIYSKGWWLLFSYDEGNLYFGWYMNSYGDYRQYHANRSTWYNDTWYDVAVTFDPALPSGNLKFYINGTLDSQHDDTYAIRYDPSAERLQIGGYPGYSYNYGGLIDEVRLWNVTRTLSEIGGTMSRTLNDTEITNPNLIGYWRFDEGNGTSSHDYSQQKNDATLLPYSHPPQWSLPGAPITPEFTSLPLILVLVTSSSLGVVLVRTRRRVKR